MRYQRAKNVAWRRIGGEMVLVNLDRRRMLALNECGAILWEATANGIDDSTDFGASDESTGSMPVGGLVEFLEDLEREGVLERPGDTTSGRTIGVAVLTAGGPPTITWREDMHRFGGSCGMVPYGGGLCDQKPMTS